jgi:hypothetical protein
MTTTPNMPDQPDSNDFSFTLKIPYVGEFQVTLYEPAWNASTQFVRTKLPWLLAIASSGTIGAHVLGKFVPPSAPPPRGEIPSQTK